MARFKIGDLVRVVSRNGYRGYWGERNVGKVGLVMEVSCNPWVCFIDGVQDYGSEECLELVTDEITPKTETHPMAVNVSIGAELTHITIGGKRFRLVPEA